MKNCYLYIRVSSDEQKNEGFSTDNQIRQCRQYAKDREYRIKEIFDDSGKSGKTADRPELQRMFKLIEEEPVDAVIIYKIDRFARNVNDFTRMYATLKDKNIKLLSINEGDLMEGGNSLIPNIFASVAQWESEVNGQRTRDALSQKYFEGWQPTPPPIGYKSIGGDRERKTCIPDPVVAPIVKELYELYSTGNYSLIYLQDWLEDRNMVSKNGTIFGRSTLNNILRNPFYYGLIRWHGESKMGNQIPIITKELYDICQYVAAKHRSFLIRKRVHNFLLRGFIYCDHCGQRFTAEWHKDEVSLKARGGKIAYYHCPKRDRNNCPAVYIEMVNLETQVEELMKTVQFSQTFIDMVIEKCKEHIADGRKNTASRIQAYVNQKTGLETKRNRLEDNLLDGTIDRTVFKRKHTEIQDRIENISNEINKIEKGGNLEINLVEEVLSFTQNIHQTYIDAPEFLKRHYLRFFFEKIYVKDRQISRVVYTPIISILAENNKVILSKSLLPALESIRTAVCGY
ncbi:MAG: recombinase family protein [Candidatus Shapirobacteria bacterium]